MPLTARFVRFRWLPWFLGRVPATVPEPCLKLLGVVSLALLLEEYDLAMLMAALKQIAGELGMAQENLGLYLALVRLGAVPAFVLIPLADRIGRRRVFLFSIAGMALATFITAFTQTPLQFVVCQALMRTFFVAGSAIAFVIVGEEFPAEHRGWGMGILAAIGAVGHGLGAAAFSQINRLPYGWRALYALGLLPLLLLPYFGRHVSETRRFCNLPRPTPIGPATIRGGLLGHLAPLKDLALTYPSRALGIVLTGYLSALALLPAFQFSGYFAQTRHGWPPEKYALMVIVAGAIGIIGNIVAGGLGDRLGRKPMGFVLLALFPLFATLFYYGPAWSLFIVWAGLVFTCTGGRLILRALATELFPTAHRSAAAGVFTVLEILGGSSGLLILYFYETDDLAQLARLISIASLATVLAAFVLLLFPETSRRILEDISTKKEPVVE